MGINIMDLEVCSVCVRAWCTVELTAIRGRSVQAAVGGGGDQHYGPLGMFSVCKSVAPRGVDHYPGSECAGTSGGDQHYGTLSMFSV